MEPEASRMIMMSRPVQSVVAKSGLSMGVCACAAEKAQKVRMNSSNACFMIAACGVVPR